MVHPIVALDVLAVVVLLGSGGGGCGGGRVAATAVLVSYGLEHYEQRVLHVCSTQLGKIRCRDTALEKLSQTSYHVFRVFVQLPSPSLRLIPISGHSHAGPMEG